MSIGQGFLVALFTMAVVFCVLALVYLLIRVSSLVIGGLFPVNRPKAVGNGTPDVPAPAAPAVSNGALRLYDIDEPTAAMIMAIVSDESGIPLSELCFRSIRRLPKNGETTKQEDFRP